MKQTQTEPAVANDSVAAQNLLSDFSQAVFCIYQNKNITQAFLLLYFIASFMEGEMLFLPLPARLNAVSSATPHVHW